MSISLSCPSCGLQSSAPAQLAGSTVQCPHCAALMVVPAVEAAMAGRAAAAALTQAQTYQAQYTCATCLGRFGADLVYDQNGVIVCHECFARASTLTARTPSQILSEPSSSPLKFQAKRRGQPAYLPWAIAGVVAAAAVGGIVALRSHSPSSGQHADSNTPTPANPPVDVPATLPAWAQELPATMPATREAIFPEEHSVAPRTILPKSLVASPVESPASATRPTSRPVESPFAAPATAPANDAWEQANKERIRQLLNQIDQVKGADKLAALLRYRELFNLVGDHLAGISDPSLKQSLLAASADRADLINSTRDSDATRAANIASLLDSGLGALESAKWKAGLESLSDVRKIIEAHAKPSERVHDAAYLTALDGMAVAYAHVMQLPRAGELFEDGTVLDKAAQHPDAAREVVWNRAVIDMRQKYKVMRAAKGLREFMERNKLEEDEQLLDLYWTALAMAFQNPPADTRFLNQCVEFYQVHNAELEKKRPGMRHWGVQWIDEAEAQVHINEQKKAIAAWQAAVQRATAASNNYKQVENAAHRRLRGSGVGEAQVDAAKRQWEAAAKAADDAKAKIPHPPGLSEYQTIVPRRLTTIASIAPSQTPPLSEGVAPPSVPATNPPVENAPPVGALSADPAPPPPVPTNARSVRYALAFAVDRYRLVTAAEALGDATTVRLESGQGEMFDAKVIARDERLALLEIEPSATAAGGLHYLNIAHDFAGGPVKCAAIPEANVFGPQAQLIEGKNVSAPPASGTWIVSLSEHPRLAGSPLLGADGAVVGVVLAQRDDPRTRLPATSSRQLAEFLSAHNALPAAVDNRPDPLAVFQVSAEAQ